MFEDVTNLFFTNFVHATNQHQRSSHIKTNNYLQFYELYIVFVADSPAQMYLTRFLVVDLFTCNKVDFLAINFYM